MCVCAAVLQRLFKVGRFNRSLLRVLKFVWSRLNQARLLPTEIALHCTVAGPLCVRTFSPIASTANSCTEASRWLHGCQVRPGLVFHALLLCARGEIQSPLNDCEHQVRIAAVMSRSVTMQCLDERVRPIVCTVDSLRHAIHAACGPGVSEWREYPSSCRHVLRRCSVRQPLSFCSASAVCLRACPPRSLHCRRKMKWTKCRSLRGLYLGDRVVFGDGI